MRHRNEQSYCASIGSPGSECWTTHNRSCRCVRECQNGRATTIAATSLFAALDIATGEVISQCYRRHCAVEFRKFLSVINKAVPRNLDVRLVLDNYGSHKSALIHDWLARRQRFPLHLTPTSASWLSQAKRWLANITRQQVPLQILDEHSGPSSGSKAQTRSSNPYINTVDESTIQNTE